MFLAMYGEKLKMLANLDEMVDSLVGVSIRFSILGESRNSFIRG